MKVILNGTVLAESNATIEVEGNDYFPPESLNSNFFSKSHTRYVLWSHSLFVNQLTNDDPKFYMPMERVSVLFTMIYTLVPTYQ